MVNPLKKIYTSDVIVNGNIVGSMVQTVWIWQTAGFAYDRMTDRLRESFPNHAQFNFRRIK